MLLNWFSRRGGEESPEVYTCGYRGVSAHLFPGVLWCFGCSHFNDAILPTQHPECFACGLRLHWLACCKVRCGSRVPVCSVNKVKESHIEIWISVMYWISYRHLISSAVSWGPCSQCPVSCSPWPEMDSCSNHCIKSAYGRVQRWPHYPLALWRVSVLKQKIYKSDQLIQASFNLSHMTD